MTHCLLVHHLVKELKEWPDLARGAACFKLESCTTLVLSLEQAKVVWQTHGPICPSACRAGTLLETL